MNFLVLGGGTSSERDVSKRSSAAVQSALVRLGHTVTYLDPKDTDMQTIVNAGHQHDATLSILHGKGGEDGTLQEVFEAEAIAFFGSGANSCRQTFNKQRFKERLVAHNLPTPQYEIVTKDTFSHSQLIQHPFVLKPIEGGSSIDTFIVRTADFDAQAIDSALDSYSEMLLEELIEGSEITVGVLSDTALPVIEIIPPADEEFDYLNKYNGATSELCPPANIDAGIQARSQELALAIHQLSECRHISRTDFMINSKGDLFAIDCNVLPGLTAQSLFPKAAKEAGYDWLQLVDQFVRMAISDK